MPRGGSAGQGSALYRCCHIEVSFISPRWHEFLADEACSFEYDLRLSFMAVDGLNVLDAFKEYCRFHFGQATQDYAAR